MAEGNRSGDADARARSEIVKIPAYDRMGVAYSEVRKVVQRTTGLTSISDNRQWAVRGGTKVDIVVALPRGNRNAYVPALESPGK